MIAELKEQVEWLHDKYPEDPIITMGDWNWTLEEMKGVTKHAMYSNEWACKDIS